KLLVQSCTDDARVKVELELVFCKRMIADELLNGLVQVSVCFDPGLNFPEQFAHLVFAFSLGFGYPLGYRVEVRDSILYIVKCFWKLLVAHKSVPFYLPLSKCF